MRFLYSIAGIVCKRENDAADLLLKMLSEVQYRDSNGVGVLINDNLKHANSIEKLDLEGNKAYMSIGSTRLAIINDFEGIQPIKGCGDFFIILNGEIYNRLELMNELTDHKLLRSIDAEVVIHLFEEQLKKYNLIEAVKRTLGYLDGMYAFAIAFKDKIIISRDPVGIKPLYLAESNSLIAFASERKALWKIGMTDGIITLPPGIFAMISRDGTQFHKGIGLKEKIPQKIKFEEVKKNLLSLLTRSIEKMIKYEKLGVLFSGGLDSYLVAHIANILGAKVELFCSSFSEFRDKQNAFYGAKNIGLTLHFHELTQKEIEECLPKILYAIEEPSPLNLSIAIPIYFATKLAKEKSFKVTLAGQGSDEIFGGYARYVKILENDGYRDLHDRLCQDISDIAFKNLQRDDGIGMANGVEIRLPFLDLELLNYAIKIPPEFKIRKIESNYVRKYILRSLAKKLDLPEEIINRKKIAVQYGSGAWKALKILSREKGYCDIKKYLQEEFSKFF